MGTRSRRLLPGSFRFSRVPRSLVVALLVAAALVAMFAIPALGANFTDVPSNHPYAQAIQELANRGVIAGYGDGRFGPGDPVIRQQFAKMIVLTLGLSVADTDVCPFVDVQTTPTPGELYPDHYVAVCAQNGITVGKDATHFAPYDHITRAQVITMVVRAADTLHPGTLVAAAAGYQSTWNPAFSPEHGQNARKAEYNGLLAGLPLTTLDPLGAMPRGEVAQVLYNLLLKLGSSPTTSSSTTSSTTSTTQPTVKSWIRYKISTGTMNLMPRIHGSHVAWLGLVGNKKQAFLYDMNTEMTSQITQGSTWDYEYLDIQGNWVALQATDGSHSEVFLYDIGAQKLSMIANSNIDDEHPSISSGRIAWSGFDGQDWELWVYDTAIGQAKQLTNNAQDEREPEFDGEWVVSTGYWGGAKDVDVFLDNVDGTFSRLLRTDADDLNPQVRGNFVVWERHDPARTDIYLHDIALQKTTNLTHGTDPGQSPTMDGGRIVWRSWKPSDWTYHSELMVYDISSKTTTRLTHNAFSDYSPQLTGHELVWSGDTKVPGTDIYYCDLGKPGFGPIEQLIIDPVARNMYPQVHQGKVVWNRQWTEYDVFLAEKVDIPIYPVSSNSVPR